jgi:hypothetical protein
LVSGIASCLTLWLVSPCTAMQPSGAIYKAHDVGDVIGVVRHGGLACNWNLFKTVIASGCSDFWRSHPKTHILQHIHILLLVISCYKIFWKDFYNSTFEMIWLWASDLCSVQLWFPSNHCAFFRILENRENQICKLISNIKSFFKMNL